MDFRRQKIRQLKHRR